MLLKRQLRALGAPPASAYLRTHGTHALRRQVGISGHVKEMGKSHTCAPSAPHCASAARIHSRIFSLGKTFPLVFHEAHISRTPPSFHSRSSIATSLPWQRHASAAFLTAGEACATNRACHAVTAAGALSLAEITLSADAPIPVWGSVPYGLMH